MSFTTATTFGKLCPLTTSPDLYYNNTHHKTAELCQGKHLCPLYHMIHIAKNGQKQLKGYWKKKKNKKKKIKKKLKKKKKKKKKKKDNADKCCTEDNC
jgi:predicted HAD superfamily Cof-like phosphohydrolase